MVRAFFDHCEAKVSYMDQILDLSELSLTDATGLSEEEVLRHFGKEAEKERLKSKVDEILVLQKRREAAKLKFSASHVEKWFEGISKKNMGLVMKRLRKQVTKEATEMEYFEWVLQTDYDVIKTQCRLIYEELLSESSK